MTQIEQERSHSRWALTFIFFTMLIDTIGLGVIIPIFPKLITGLTGQSLSGAAQWSGWLMFSYSAMLFLFSPMMGNLSDRIGRKPILIASLLALCIDYFIMGVAQTIWWLFLGRILSGIAGASYTTANAYIADVTPPEKRAANFGLVGAAFGIGFVLGPALGGLLGQYGLRLPFFVSSGIALANALFGLLVMRESLGRERRRKFELWRANPVGSLKALSRYPGVMGFVVILILMRLAHDANPAIWTYYTYLKFGWGPREVGLSLAFLGLAMALVFAFLTRYLIPKIGEGRAAYIGLISGALGFAGYALATKGWMLYPWMLVWSLMGLAMPSINAIISKEVASNEQGELQGALASVGGITSIVAPVLITSIFAFFTAKNAPVYFPGAGFLTAGLFLAAAAALLVRATHRRPAEAGVGAEAANGS